MTCRLISAHFSEVDVQFETAWLTVDENEAILTGVCIYLLGDIQDDVMVDVSYETVDGSAVGEL